MSNGTRCPWCGRRYLTCLSGRLSKHGKPHCAGSQRKPREFRKAFRESP